MKIIGICGPSGSGKSTVAEIFAQKLNAEIVHTDAFFKNQLPTMVSPEDGKEYPDWNSPESVRYGEVAAILRDKKEKNEAEYLIVEGLLIFAIKEIRELLDIKIFVSAAPETCLYRRIMRNTSLFGMSVQEVGEYYLKCARHRERQYCLPYKKDADFVLENETDCTEEINNISNRINMKKILCLLLLAVMLLLSSCAPRLGDKASLTDWFHENEDAFMEVAESGDFTSLEKLRGVESVSRSDGCVDILCGGNGFGPGTHYYGLYYAEEDIWAGFAADPASAWTVEGDGYRFREKDGDNVFYVEPLGGGYYYYEQHF